MSVEVRGWPRRVTSGVLLIGLLAVGWACAGRLARSAPAAAKAALANCTDGEAIAVVHLPLPQRRLRSRLMLEYVRDRYNPGAERLDFVPRMIVLHWTELPTFRALWDAFRSARIPPWRPELLRAGRVNVASQFGVDRNGAIYRFLPESVIARHVIGLNRVAIGIENVGGSEAPLTECQIRADAKLIADLVARYPTIRYLIGHHEYGRFRGTPLWEERDPDYFTNKVDPGDEFMAAVRSRIEPLDLRGEYTPDLR